MQLRNGNNDLKKSLQISFSNRSRLLNVFPSIFFSNNSNLLCLAILLLRSNHKIAIVPQSDFCLDRYLFDQKKRPSSTKKEHHVSVFRCLWKSVESGALGETQSTHNSNTGFPPIGGRQRAKKARSLTTTTKRAFGRGHWPSLLPVDQYPYT